MVGNDGWSYKVRFVDPLITASKVTKRILYHLLEVDKNGEPKIDDLGNLVYMNGEFAHAILINELCTMVDADDFCIRHTKLDEGGNEVFDYYEFPALEKIKYKYPWVEGIIEKLRTDHQATAAFFHDFNKAFIQYGMMDSDGVYQPLNEQIGASAGRD